MGVRLQPLWIWERDETLFYQYSCKGLTLHVCCGKSLVGNIRVDRYEPTADILADYRYLPFRDRSFDTVLCDPPWGKRERVDLGVINWLRELSRVARQRIIIIHNTMFTIFDWKLEEAWAVCAHGGFLYKVMSIYKPDSKEGEQLDMELT